jgi:alpha-tubulin suppressor-like RCC1 family protein/uncharacterized protein YkwD/plastocyanin/thiol-disulfide isomerase/thioredoxin/uncharacterized membrane protein YphA (DoxX/SURF4 family)
MKKVFIGRSLAAILKNKRLMLILRIVLGTIFLTAAVAKFPHQLEFISVVSSYNILPYGLTELYGSMLPWIELTVGCLLILGLFTRLASGISITLILSFITAGIYAIFWGGASGNGSCGCFAEMMPLSHTESLILNTLMLMMAVPLMLYKYKPFNLILSRHKFSLVPKRITCLALGRSSRTATILLVMFILAPSPSLAMADSRPVANISGTNAAASLPVASVVAANTNVIRDTIEVGRPEFVFFYSDTCHYCQQEKPVINELEQEYHEKIDFVRISGPDNPQAMEEYGVKGYPTMFLLTTQDGGGDETYNRFDGFTDKETLKTSFNDLLEKTKGPEVLEENGQSQATSFISVSSVSVNSISGTAGNEKSPSLTTITLEPNLSTFYAMDAPGDPPGDVSVNITDNGFKPAIVTILAGQGVHWTNQSSQPQSVTANSSLFDSGELQPGAGFSIALAIPGTYDYYSTNNAAFQGQVRVFLQEMPGLPDELASDHIPDMVFPPAEEADFSYHPTLAFRASRTRILVGFKPDTTVAQANDALQAAGTPIMGGLPDMGMLLVQGPDTPDFSGIIGAQETLLANPAVEFAAMDMAVETKVIPQAAENITLLFGSWIWDLTPDGGNWGLEASRFPQAWNWMDVIQRNNPQIRTGIIDGGFEAHKDLSHLNFEPLCRTSWLGLGSVCTTVVADAHGNHVAGIIGADFNNLSNNRSVGISGANPFALMNGISYKTNSNILGSSSGEFESFNLLLDAAKKGTIPNLRVINYSVGLEPPDPVKWWKTFDDPHRTCGPDEKDDNTPTASLWCTPDNEDAWLAQASEHGKAALRVAERAAGMNPPVMIIQAAGNESDKYKIPATTLTLPISTEKMTEFAWASKHWTKTDLPNPIIIVEAIKHDLARVPGSNLHGDISAPGEEILSTVLNNNYESENWTGTSFATPHVTALIGYMLAYKPDLTIPQVKDLLFHFARQDTTDNASARIDAFASMMAIPGAAKDLVDVNDASKDGNQRVTLPPEGIESPVTIPPDPDGRVDMRDFRRFRDAWLQVCQTYSGSSLPLPLECPNPADIILNGPSDHPAKDLNRDGCVNPGADCMQKENIYPRFDFNGDGIISLSESDKIKVPVKQDGTPAANLNEATEMTDLDVFKSQWKLYPGDSEGWTDADLSNLIVSGDLEIHADEFFQAKATDVEITIGNAALAVPKQHITMGQEYIVITVPVIPPDYTVEISALAIMGEQTLISMPKQIPLHPGEDVRVDLHITGLTLEADPATITAGLGAVSTITATLKLDEGEDPAGKTVTFTVEPTGPNHATISPASDTTDANGKVVTFLAAGSIVQDYTITATADMGGGEELTAKITVHVKPRLVIKYVWQEELLDYWQEGSTRWPTANATMPDCTTAGVGYCIDQSHVQLTQPSSPLERRGTITGGGSTFYLSENVTQSPNQSTSTFTLSDPDGSNVRSGSIQYEWGVYSSEITRYQDYTLKGVSSEVVPDGVRVGGLMEIAELGYLYNDIESQLSGTEKPVELGGLTTGLILVPRGDGSAFQYAGTMGPPILFQSNPDGSFQPYQFVGTFTVDLTTTPGYRLATASSWVPGAVDLNRKTTFEPGDRPMPVGPGLRKVRYCMAAVASYDPNVPAPALPDCSVNNPPTADFSFQFFDKNFSPTEPAEGRVARFTDLSTDQENNLVSWQWDFQDGTTKTDHPTWYEYRDSGSFNVKLTVTDAEGLSASTTKTVTVANLPPTCSVDDVAAQVGTSANITYHLDDPGPEDRKALNYQLTSSNTSFPSLQPGTDPVGDYTLSISGLPVGAYTVTLTVTDKDGASCSDDAVITITAGPPPPPPVTPPPEQPPKPGYVTCDPDVSLDGEEHEFLDLINAYRIENGLSPVLGVSPTLTKAAELHSQDMATNNFFSHTGSDGSDWGQRANDAGYPSNIVGENILQGTPLALEAMLGWKTSAPHNMNMLDPRWRAIGIARVEGNNGWYWTTDFGDVLDCPEGTTGTSVGAALTSSEMMLTSPACQSCLWPVMAVSSSNLEGTSPVFIFTSPIVLVSNGQILEVPQPQSPDPAPVFPPVPAFVISRASPYAGQPVNFINVSRDATGQPIGAVLDPGDGSPVINLDPGQSYQYTYDATDTVTVSLTATDTDGRQLTVSRSIVVTSGGVPPEVTSGDPLAWGYNGDGELGDGTTTSHLTPVRMSNLRGVVAMAGGRNHSLALATDGIVWAWGQNSNGQLGDGTYGDHYRPVPVVDLTGVVAIAAGYYHSLALKSDGSVWAWGQNGNGQLGDGTTNYRLTPVQVSGPGGIGALDDVVAIDAGSYYSLALRSDGSVWAWGYNYGGQLGDGTTTTRLTPVQVSGPMGTGTLGGVVAIAAGYYHSLALRSDGSVWAWGSNGYGQLGDGTTTTRLTPVQVSGPGGTGTLGGVVAIAAGSYYSLALRSDGSVWAWGFNYDGCLGDGTTTTRLTPVQVLGLGGNGTLGNVVAIAAGGGHGLAVQQPATPAQPANDNFAAASMLSVPASLSGNTFLATTEPGEPVPSACGAIGKTIWYKLIPELTGIFVTTAGSTFDTRLALYTGSALSDLTAIACDDNSGPNGTSAFTAGVIVGQTYYLQVGGTPFSSGMAYGGDFMLQFLANTPPSAVNDAYAMDQDTTLRVPAPGVLTNDADTEGGSLTAALVSGPSNGTLSLNANGSFTYTPNAGFSGTDTFTYKASDGATDSSPATVTIVVWPPATPPGTPGDPLAWGYNVYGQLGDGTTNTRSLVAPVSNLRDVVAVAAGTYHSLALKADGTVWAWGVNSYGQLGDGTTTYRYRPVPVGGLTRIVAIAAGDHHGLALRNDGSVWAWGYNNYGQLGDGTATRRLNPVQVSGLTDVVAITAGNYYSLALKSDGSVWAWGYNIYGQLGDGTTNTRYTPVQLSGLTDVVAITAGYYHSLALKSDGSVWAWGFNNYGQLGDGTTNTIYTPAQVSGLTDVVAITAGGYHSLALRGDESVWAWGFNNYGQLGDGTSTNHLTPVQVSGPGGTGTLDNVVAIAAGGTHTLALRSDGSVWTWGNNNYGQLGDGTTNTRYTPVQVSGPGGTGTLDNVVAIAAGVAHSLVVQPPAAPPQPPVNDNFAAASALVLPASLSGDTMMATTQAAEPVPAVCGDIGKTVWYRIVPTETGILVASTRGSTFDTRLALYTGSALSDLTAIACDDNSGGNGTSILITNVTAGQTYYLQLGGASFFPGTAHAGSFTLKVLIGHRPENDNFAAAMSLTLPASVSGDNLLATVEDDEPVQTCGNVGYTVWYELTPAVDGVFAASAQSNTFQPILALYTLAEGTDTPLARLNSAAQCESGYQWRLSADVQAGRKYYLQLGSGGGMVGGDFTLQVNVYPPPPNDNFADASPLNVPGSTTGTTLGATTEPDEPRPTIGCQIDHTVWYQFVPQVTGELRLGKEADFSTVFILYSGTSLATLIQLSDGYVWTPEPSLSLGIVEAGQTYYLQVATEGCMHSGLGGDFILNTALGPTPDLVVTSLSVVADTTDEPISVNITVTNQGDASTLTSFFVYLFSATSLTPTSQSSPLVTFEVPTLDAGASATENITLPPDTFEAGTHTLTAYADATDAVDESNEFNNLATVDLTVTPPPILERDNFSQANLLTLPANVSGSTVQATTQLGEPLNCGSKVMGKTVWFKIIPNASGALTATTNGSDFDTMLAIYTGSSLAGLQQKGCNDDAGGSDRTSRLFLTVTGGQTYYLQLGGYQGDSGQFNLYAALDTSGKPDLVVTSLTAEPGNADQPIPVHFTIANYGSGGTGVSFRVHLFADLADPPTTGDTPLMISDNISLPAPGDSVSLSMELPAGSLAAGDHVVWALADGQGVVDETDESNNTASTQVPVAGAPPPPTGPDFTLTVTPATLALVPGSSASLSISLASFYGFSDPVMLSVLNLPQGVTGSFYPDTVTPPGTSILALTASPDAVTGNFQFHITGSSDNLTHTAGGAVALNFGLVPMCYAIISGVVTDIETGAPVAGVVVFGAGSEGVTTDAGGHYTITDVSLGPNNSPLTVSVAAGNTNYWTSSASGTAICSVTTTVDIQVLRKRTGTVSGVITTGDPPVPLPGAAIVLSGTAGSGEAVSGADGTYQIGPLGLNEGNAPARYSYEISADGYWEVRGNLVVQADQDTQLNATLVAQCTGSISGTLVNDEGTPVAGFLMNASQTTTDMHGYSVSVEYQATSDDAGAFSFPAVLLGYNNEKAVYMVSTSNLQQGDTVIATGNATLENCGDTVTVSLVLETVQAKTWWLGVVKGTVTDIETGEPVPGVTIVYIGMWAGATYTDMSGHYQFEIAEGEVSVGAGASGNYYGDEAEVIVPRQSEVTLDFSLLRMRFGVIEGTVRDAASKEPIAGASIYAGTADATTGLDGKYQTPMLSLDYPNQPRQLTLRTTASGYWPKISAATISADQTTTVDVELIPICQGATIVGKVVNAVTLQPIEGATVSADGKFTDTDKDGFFRLEGLTVGTNNSPTEVTVTASAKGFYPQSKLVTIFCGATITLDFGQPETAWGTIIGTVTSSRTGGPLPGVFIGSGFGDSATTDTSGNYRLEKAPLGDDNADRLWQVTAIYPGAPYQSGEVTVKANQESRLDFQFDVEANAPPVAQDQAVTTNASVTVNITLAASDADGDALTFSLMTLPEYGELSGIPPDLTYTPDKDFSGSDNFTFIANDGQADSNIATVTITVNAVVNHSPVITTEPTHDVAEGEAFTHAVGFTDTDTTDNHTGTIDWDDGSPPEALVITESGGSGEASPSHTYPDNGSFTAAIEVCDENDACDSAQVTIQVANVPPTVDAGTDASLNAGDTFARSGSFTDPGADNWTATVDYGDGSGVQPLALNPDKTFNLSHLYPDSGTFTVTVEVTDDDGGVGTAIINITVTVTVVNQPPVITTEPTHDVAEGEAFTHAVGFTDTDTTDNHTGTIDWDDGSPPEALVITESGGSGEASPGHTYPDNGSFTAAIEVCDEHDACDSTQVTIQVANVPPTVDAGNDASLNAGDTFARSGSFTDPGADNWTATVDYGDSSGVQPLALNPDKTFNLSHLYPDSGTFTITVEVTDDDGGVGTAIINITVTVTVVNQPPVAEDQTVATKTNTPVNITLAASDPDGDPLTYSVMKTPGHGALSDTPPYLTYTPAANYTGSDNFTFKANDGQADSNVATVSITISAVVEVHTIIATAGAGGSISPSGPVTVNHGGDQAFTITPDTGYRIDDVLVDGLSAGAVSSYTFNSVTENHTISASFTPIETSQFEEFLIKHLHINWGKTSGCCPGKDKGGDICWKKYEQYLDYRTKFGEDDQKTQRKFSEYLQVLVRSNDCNQNSCNEIQKVLDKYENYLDFRKKFGENDKKTQARYREYLEYVDRCHDSCKPPLPSSNFYVYGRLKVPEGMSVADFERLATVTLTISNGSISDSIVFTKGSAKLRGAWQGWGDDKLDGVGLDVEKMSLWWAPNNSNWAGWAGFHISGEFIMPEGVNGNTQPPRVTVTVDLTTKTSRTVTGTATVLCKVSGKGLVWQYNAQTGWPFFPYDLPDEDD